MHEVLSGQEIEDIAKAYYAPIADILKENPEIRTGLKPGMALRIPYTDESLEAMTNDKSSAEVLSDVTPKKLEEKPDRVPATPILPQKQPEKPKSQTPIQEAVSLLNFDEEKPEVEEVEEPMVEEVKKQVEEIVEEESQPELEPEIITEPEPEKVEEPISEIKEEVVEEIKEELPVAPVVVEKPIEEKKRTTRRVNIEPDPDAKPQSLEDKAELADLTESIRESLSTLEKMKKALAGEAIEEAAIDSDRMGEEQYALDFLKEKLNERLVIDSGLHEFYLKEYFMAQVDPNGVIISLRDERTITNQNTQDLVIQDVAGLKLRNYQKLDEKTGETAIGLNADVTIYHYELKVKKKKIRIYNDDMFVEYLDKDHPHYEMIRAKAEELDEKGKCDVVIADGTLGTARYGKVEYNPFGEQKDVIDEEEVLRLISIEFK